MDRKIYNITEEQLNSIDSEFMTRDALAVIANEVRITEPVTREISNEETKVMLERSLKILNELDPKGYCRLFALDNRYCNRECPFGAKFYQGRCGIRVMKTDLRQMLGVE